MSRQRLGEWYRRWKLYGEAGLEDRSSRPLASPNQISEELGDQIEEMRRGKKFGPDRISGELALLGIKVAPATVHRELVRRGLNRLRTIDPPTGEDKVKPVRYEHKAPGDMLHVDVKKVGKIPLGGGWWAHGRESQQALASKRKANKRPGYTYLHACVAIAQPLTVEEVDGALSPAISAYVDQFSEESYAPVAAAAQSLIDAKRPYPVVDPLTAVLAEAQIKLLAEYPGHATLTTDYRDVFRAISLLRPIAPSLPVVLLDGNYTVGDDVAPGRYRTVGAVDGCYWETLDEAGEINDNNFVNAAPQVIMTIRQSDFAVNSEDCGPWVLI